MLRARPFLETSVSRRLIWQARKRMRRSHAAMARVPVRRRRLTYAVRSSVRPRAPTARILVGAGTPPASRSRSNPSRNSRVERGHDCPLSLGANAGRVFEKAARASDPGRAAALRGGPENHGARERRPQGRRGRHEGARKRSGLGEPRMKSHRKVLTLHPAASAVYTQRGSSAHATPETLMTSWLISGWPRQFCVMWQNMRCSISSESSRPGRPSPHRLPGPVLRSPFHPDPLE